MPSSRRLINDEDHHQHPHHHHFKHAEPVPHGKCYTCLPGGLTISGLIFLAIGLFLLFGAPGMVMKKIHKELDLSNHDSMLFKIWSDNEREHMPITRSIYMWNCSNAQDVLDTYATPDFTRVGPFVFRERQHTQVNENINDDSEVSFLYKQDLTFVPELSIDPNIGQLSLNTSIITSNVAVSAFAYRLGQFPPGFLKPMTCGMMAANLKPHIASVDAPLTSEGLFINVTVSQFLFGYKDSLWETAKGILNTSEPDYASPGMFRVLWNHALPAPSPISIKDGQRCPMWDNQSECNTTATGRSVVMSGHGHTLKQVGQFKQWAGQKEFWWWGNGHCQVIEGSGGVLYPSGLDESATPYVVMDEIYRKFKLRFASKVEVKGIHSLRFYISDEEMLLGQRDSECYGQKYTGVLNLTRTMFGPLFMTKPYFMHVRGNERNLEQDGDSNKPILNIKIDGVPIEEIQNKDQEDKETFVDVYPLLGTLMQGKARLQIATWLKPLFVPGCQEFTITPPKNVSGTMKTFPYTLMPVVYIDREAGVSDHVADRIKNEIVMTFKLLGVFGFIFSVVGPMFVIFAAFISFRRRKQDFALDEETMLPEVTDSESEEEKDQVLEGETASE